MKALKARVISRPERWLSIPDIHLFPRLGCHGEWDAFAVAQDDHLYRLADLHGIQRVGVIVDAGDFSAGELDDDVAAFEARFVRGAAGADAAEFDALDVGGIIRDKRSLFQPSVLLLILAAR